MQKTILITGSTDGIGLATARRLVSVGQHVLLHGRSSSKLADAQETLSGLPGAGPVEGYAADLSVMANVETLANAVTEKHAELDVLINNAGVYSAPELVTQDGLDIRFAVNTIAPYLLTQRLLPLLGASGRVVNLSSAAQSSVDPRALAGGQGRLPDGAVLLGALSDRPRTYSVPAAAASRAGYLVLYSLAHQEVVAAGAVPAMGSAP